MTKREARSYLNRVRQGVNDAMKALHDNDPEALYDALTEISGSAGTVESALINAYGEDEPDGVDGLLYEP